MCWGTYFIIFSLTVIWLFKNWFACTKYQWSPFCSNCVCMIKGTREMKVEANYSLLLFHFYLLLFSQGNVCPTDTFDIEWNGILDLRWDKVFFKMWKLFLSILWWRACRGQMLSIVVHWNHCYRVNIPTYYVSVFTESDINVWPKKLKKLLVKWKFSVLF